jgi:hypothetical protein
MYLRRLIRMYTTGRTSHRRIYKTRYIFMILIGILMIWVYILVTSYIYHPANRIIRITYTSGSLDTIYDTTRYTDLNRQLSGMSHLWIRYNTWPYTQLRRRIQASYPYISDIRYQSFSSNTVRLSLVFTPPSLLVRTRTRIRWIYPTSQGNRMIQLLPSNAYIRTTPTIALPVYADSYTGIDSLLTYLPHDTIIYTLSQLAKTHRYTYIPVSDTLGFVYDGVVIYISIKNKNLSDIDARLETLRALRPKIPNRSRLYAIDIWHSPHPILTYK